MATRRQTAGRAGAKRRQRMRAPAPGAVRRSVRKNAAGPGRRARGSGKKGRRAAARSTRARPVSARSGRTPRARRPVALRLSPHVRPTAYRVDLSVDANGGVFSGSVAIELDIGKPRRSLELHAAGIKVSRATWQEPGRGVNRGRIVTHRDRETVEIFPSMTIAAGRGILTLHFSAALQDGLRGLYGVRAGGSAYAFTQLEAADARRFFPCFDEPSFKARFTFRVTTDAAYTVISNGPQCGELLNADGSKTTEFAPTPKLSTYLCALALGPLEGSEPRWVGSTPIRVWHVPGKSNLTATALETAANALIRLQNYFDMPYPYDKLDLVAVPDFEAGAMENAGAVFFRETLVLCDPATITLAEHKRLAEVIAHELAHMWFGNLVTMAWWNDLWLNEAFATWIAFRVVDEWKPRWKMWNNFEHYRAAALEMDALASTHPVYAEVRDATGATENFDAITYEKGAAVVRMLERYLGAEQFRDGVRLYIRRHREGNAKAQDLWRALSEVSGQQVDRLARDWIENPGFPLLTVRGDSGDGPVGFAVRQERFFARPGVPAAARHHRWPVPLLVRYQISREPPAIARYLITKAREHVFLDAPGPLRWYYANADEAGFFRVRHDPLDLASLTAALPGSLGPVERMGLVSHQWALVCNGAAPIETFLDLVDRLGEEDDHDVLDRLAAALAGIEDRLLDAAGTEARAAFRRWLERRFMPQLIRCGWDPKPAESEDARLRRAAIVRILGAIAEVPAVCSTAAARADRYLHERRSLDANLVDTAVTLAARAGGDKRFEGYRAAVRGSRTPQERRRFRLALAAFRAPDLIERALALSLTDEVPTQDVALLLIRAFANPVARRRAWRFVKTRWTQLRRRLPPMMIARLIEATSDLQTRACKREVAAFFRRHPVPTARRTLRQTLERFDLIDDLQRRASPGLARWLARVPDTRAR